MKPPNLPERLMMDIAVRVIATLAACSYGAWITWALLHAIAGMAP